MIARWNNRAETQPAGAAGGSATSSSAVSAPTAVVAPGPAEAVPPRCWTLPRNIVLAQTLLVAAAVLVPALAADQMLAQAGRGADRFLLLGLAAASIVGGVALHLLLTRSLRQSLQPLVAVESSLSAYAAGIERELLSLSLSDSLGQVAGAWNQLLRQMAELQEQSKHKPTGQSALTRFELRSLRQTLDRVPFGVLRLGGDERVRYANPAAARLLDAPVESVQGGVLADLLGEDCSAALLGALKRGAGARSVDRVRGEGATRRALRLELIPGTSEDRDGLIVLQDITHLQEAEQARDNLLYHVTHELRTPLTNIQAYAETLSRIEMDDEQTRKECYNVIVSETSRLSRLIEDILSVSQLEVGSLRVEWSDVDLQKLVRQMVQDNLGGADEKKINLSLKLPPKLPHIRGDKHKLAVMFNNLIGNAVKYTRENGRVDVRVESDAKCVKLVVVDTGIGIPEKDLAHVFDKFYRAAQDEVQLIKGTGLGLAISREIAHLHGGEIRVESVLNKGSTFTVELPLQASVAAA